MRCPKCDTENKEGRKFCSKCGSKFENVCPKCGYKNDPDDTFCGECGAELGVTQQAVSKETTIPKLEDMHSQLQSLIPDILAQKYLTAEHRSGENRPITAIFADISGFTPLSATKSSETMFRLVQDCFKQLVSIVASYEGSISGFRGDGLLALFGAPIIHENDAERAVLAAIDMRSAMRDRQLEISVGINTATMTVGEIQTELHKEYTAYSIDINLAKRLQESAKPGQIMVGTGTYRLTRRIFDFEELPSLQLKGFANPVTAYSLQKIKAHPEKLRGIEGMRAMMVGRDEEFEKLIDSTNEWLDGKGQIISIIGEAGIGKSRLVSELKEYLGRDEKDKLHLSSFIPHPFLEGRCISIGQSISYWPFLDILRGWLNISGDDTEIEIIHKVKEQIGLLMPDRIDDILPYLGQLMNLKFGDEVDNVLKNYSPEQVKHGIMMRLRDIFIALSQRNRLMLILEDLHWTDELSLDLIHLLMDELLSHPIMLVCVYRPEQGHNVIRLSNSAQRKCPDRYTKIDIDKLSSSESRRLVSELLAIDNLPDSVRDMIISKSEGNPFFIEEVIRSLMERGLVYKENERWKANDNIIELEVPDTIQSVLLERIDRLEAEAKYVLQCASVIGRLFKYNLLDHITQKQKELDRYLDEFEKRDLAYQERTMPEMEYAFKHALTQDATYQGILEQRRMAFHRNVALGIEKLYQERIEEFYEELAHHWEHSGDKDKTLEYLVKAGEKATKSYLNEMAIEYYTRALKLAKGIGIAGDRLAEIYEARGNIYYNIFYYEESLVDLMEAANLYTQRKQRASAYRLISWTNGFCIGDTDEASLYANRAADEYDTEDKSWETCDFYVNTAGGLNRSGNFYRAKDILKKAIAISEEMGYFDILARSYSVLLWFNTDIMADRGGNYRQENQDAWNKANQYLPHVKTDLVNYSITCAALSYGATFCDLPVGKEDIIYFSREAIDSGIKAGMVWSIIAGVVTLHGVYASQGAIEQELEVCQQAWDTIIKVRYIFFYGMPWLMDRLMEIYATKGDKSNLKDMALQILDSTLELHAREYVNPKVNQAWNNIVEHGYRKLYDLSPETCREFRHSLEICLNNEDDIGRKFFYHYQLLLVSILDNSVDDIKYHAQALVDLSQKAGNFAQHISSTAKFIMEFINPKSDKRWEAITEILKENSFTYDFQKLLDTIDWLIPDKKNVGTINWDGINSIMIDHLKKAKGTWFINRWLPITKFYRKFGRENDLLSLSTQLQQSMPDILIESGITHLFPEKSTIDEIGIIEYADDFIQDPVDAGWEWVNPDNKCKYELAEESGLIINLNSGYDLWVNRTNAPRLLRAVSGDFITEIKVSNGPIGKKLGGLTIWKDERNFLRFDMASSRIWYEGCVYCGANVDGKFTQPGIHPFEADKVWLRLERKGDRFTGYVSSDGENWYICGWTDIPMENPIKVGIHALCPDSPATSTRFEYFKIYRIKK